MKKNIKKSIVFALTLLMSTTPIFATQKYHKNYDTLKTQYADDTWYSYSSGNNAHTGLAIRIGRDDFWNGDIVLKYIKERNMNSDTGLSQTFTTHNGDGKYLAFTGECFAVGTTEFFYTTKDINKGILPTTKYIKPVTYTSKYVQKLNGYILDVKDAKMLVEEYAKTNGIADYYYKSMDVMQYDGEHIDNIRSGFGKMYNLDGDLIYIGMWDNGVFNGFGITFRDGEASYIGEWRDGLPNGMGVIKKNPKSTYYTEVYSYIDSLNNVSRMEISSKYKLRSKYEDVANMAIPFKGNKNLYMLSDLNEDKLISICNNYDDFKIWSSQKSEEIVDFNTNPPY